MATIFHMDTIKQAREIAKTAKENDLEDMLQYVCALQNNCELIITNDKSFYHGDIKLSSTNS